MPRQNHENAWDWLNQPALLPERVICHILGVGRHPQIHVEGISQGIFAFADRNSSIYAKNPQISPNPEGMTRELREL